MMVEAAMETQLLGIMHSWSRRKKRMPYYGTLCNFAQYTQDYKKSCRFTQSSAALSSFTSGSNLDIFELLDYIDKLKYIKNRSTTVTGAVS